MDRRGHRGSIRGWLRIIRGCSIALIDMTLSDTVGVIGPNATRRAISRQSWRVLLLLLLLLLLMEILTVTYRLRLRLASYNTSF